MMEKVQCPVCTLFLHVGMNLSDHLETHPKEQVIKALVQMTVTRPLDDFKSLPSVEPVVGKQPDEDSLSQSPSSVVDKEKDRCSNFNTDSSSSVSLTCATNNNLNFHLDSQQQKKRISPTTTTAALFKHSGKHEFNTQNVTSSPAYQKSIGAFNLAAEIREGVVDVAKNVSSIPTGFSSFSNRCQLTSQIQQQQDTCSQSPPPQSEVDQKSTQLPFSGTSQSFHSKLQTQQHQLQFLTPAHQSNIQQHQQQRQLHQLPLAQHDNIKIFYSSSLPPPSPQIQVFSYQPPNQPLHQKPPPAYGAAISQIRSQYNHTKQTSLQQHQLHRSTTELMSVKVTSNSKSPILKKNVPPHQSLLSAAHHKQYPYAQQLQQQHHQHNQEQNYNQQQGKVQETDLNHQQQLPKNVANTVTPITFHKSGTYIPRGGPTSQAPPDVPISPFFGPPTSINRLTNSPFPPYLSTTMPSSSPCSSVLRYAESPVTAHYLERDNGDFIVQETPKHIVECVEKDNGEFSVIERIYQSPPSVLRIHDNDDEEDNDMKEIIEKNKVKGEEVDTEDEEFMSIDGESELEEFPTELKPYEGNFKSSKEIIYHNQDKPTNTADTANSDSVVKAVTNHPNNNNGLINSSRKKSSKNTITVLSDVQLNLNEYLDLVGNIIASSKIAKTQSFASAMPISLVKVEKVEPIDDYEIEEQKQDAACLNESLSPSQQSVMHKKSAASSPQEPAPTTTTTTTTIATTKSSTATDTTYNNIDKITETDLVAINCSNKEVSQYHPTTKIVSVNNNSSKNQVYSSHTTSVIRMASTTTSQKYVSEVEEQRDVSPKLKVQHNEDKSVSEKLIPEFKCINHFALNESDAEDLSTQVQVKTEESNNNVVDASASLLTPIKRGPKKLVIKPKSNAIESKIFREESRTLICDEKPTSFICTQKRKADTETSDQEPQESKSIVIKSEPNISIEMPSILEQHLRIPTNQSELKSETSSSRYETGISLKQECQQFSIKHERDEHNVSNQSEEKEIQMNRSSADQENENSRAVLDFTNSNKKEELEPASSNAPTFPSPNSIFGASTTEQSMLTNFAGSTSSTSAPCNMLETLRCNDEFIVPDATDVQEIVISSCYSSQSASDVALVTSNNQTDRNSQNQQSNNFADYPFSFLYGGGNVVNDIETKENLSPKYQQQTHDASTAVALASGSNSATIGDITNDMIHRNAKNNRFHQAVSASGRQWYQAISTSNTDFEAALAVDGGGCAEGSNAGNYLDLDSYKRLSMSGRGHLTATTLSSSLSSFTAATETSLPGCTPDALNIRTDEKMPEKGEISEQESNCDIETSWSQSMYGDIPVRFFKSSFPGLFPPENCWNNEEYFTVQDLSASGVTSVSNKATKSFDFRLPPENASSSTAVASSSSSTQQQQTQHIPAISCKKKRKRDSPAAKNSSSKTIASTVTLKDLQHQQQVQQQNFQQDLVQDPSLGYSQETPTTSAAVLAGASTIALAGLSNTAITANKRVAKVFTCVHCLMKFSKLKDRNHHMVDQHNYVLRNYRLIPLQKIVANEVSNIATTSNKTANLLGSSSSSTVTSFCSNIISTDQQIDIQVDSKRSIVKIELDQGEQAASTRFANSVEAIDQVLAKTEFVDEKDDLDLGSKIVATSADIPADPVFLPSLTRLYNLYHMLVSYNIAALKQNQTLSEADEKLILSSIFFCLICRQKFGSVKLYDAHMTEHPAECFTCGKKFHRWSNLSLHLKRHLGWKEFGCSVCDKKFVVRSALVEHMRMHTGQKPLKCNICEKHFKRFSNLAQHRKRHSKQILRKKEFVCFCGEVLPSKARFLWHKETHDAKPKCCPYCCDRFVHANSLRRHIRLAHSDKFDYTEPMECPMCKQVFAKSSIRAHMATHSMEMQHVCPICNKSFSTKWNLKIHSWVHANRTTKPFKCDHCPKAFVREVDFKNHINAHKQIKPYTCEYCGCKFIRKYNYMRHRREHHGNKKFTCDLCKKSFHRQYYLVEHRRIHTGERPFQCTICGKSSTTKTNHNKHLKIHHSRDPFTVEA